MLVSTITLISIILIRCSRLFPMPPLTPTVDNILPCPETAKFDADEGKENI